MLDYKGYHATAAYRPDDTLLVDRVLDLGDTVVFEAGAESQNHFVQTAVAREDERRSVAA
ncbi:MAG: hypothetical protein CMM84_19110 [Rhodothermaceae bacterium]|nr:hypothetical protein [Rhodothermaceae bacterium]MAQ95622.1 hypothetical protein [Rhodothermaceae bacterium]MBC13116.1 hypothetical protein [Rhodothermaceae bacterium]MBC14818.1 hypothetical protein [Rhodothermaceae bacterium]HAS31341.1 hypothetical protein [Microbacterium sp.]|tara:strand:- start:356 stop:535 length:180 start_codon:yes stop_codon:yes gene_type:complete